MSIWAGQKEVGLSFYNQSFPWGLSVQYIKKVGPARAILLGKLDIQTLEDLLYFLPFRYEDRTEIKKIGALVQGEEQTVYGEITSISLTQTARRNMQIVEALIRDDTGTLLAKWFNQPYLNKTFKKGGGIMVSGKVRMGFYGGAHLTMESPQYEKIDADEPQLHMGRIVPVYHETKGLTSRQIRSIMWMLLNQYGSAIPEILPVSLIEKYKFLSLSRAILELHFPEKGTSLSLLNSGKTLMHQRLAFDELFLLEIGLGFRKNQVETKEKGIAFNTASGLVTQFLGHLPFQLTSAQTRVFSEVTKDMAAAFPMHRLIQGDVGSGKTVVALMAILIAIENGFQAALMAPTEILAEQHTLSLTPYFESLGRSLLLLTSDMKKKEKEGVLARIATGEVDLVIGTHALIQETVAFKKLGLVVVDEQHKFGVLQRARLSDKGYRPDILVMTATPIPRTLALTVYGDLNLSVIDMLPPGRTPIQTRLFYGKGRAQAYQLLEEELRRGRQGYLVCPLIEKSEALDLKAAQTIAASLTTGFFSHRRVGLLHGRLKREEKESVMREFRDGRIDILVTTTVIEVGIDLPNATVMMIEHAERFGLAQLHQLRGRVGRGVEQSYCFLIAEFAQSQEARARLQVMQQTTDGFKIAEEDLKIRGPGEFFGTKQSGLPELKVANLLRDVMLLESARAEAFCWVEADPRLDQVKSASLRAALERKWKGKIEWLAVG
jgi:ATP-dependent DNA helicase RecG